MMRYHKIDGKKVPVDENGRILLLRKKRKGKSIKDLPEEPEGFIEQSMREVNIGDYVMDTGIIHALNMNIGRHIPWIEDGLKPVERRILFGMYRSKLLPSSKRAKVASIAGEIMKLHPHGDASIVETIYRVGRKFSTMLPYVDGHGNFGNMDTIDAAAPRYTEARLSPYARDCFFSDMDTDIPIYDEVDTYDYSAHEPLFLPTRFPNSLLQYSSGIGKGASTNVVAFNPTELLNAAIKLLYDEDAKINILPDTPVSLLIDKKDLSHCFDKARFKVRMRGTYRVYVDKKLVDKQSRKLVDKCCLEFESCPMNTHGRAIRDFIIKLRSSTNQLNEILNVECAGDEENLRLIVEYEKGYDPAQVAEKLYKLTPLEQTYGADYTMVVDNKLERFSPRTILKLWIEQRIEQKHQYYYQKALMFAKVNSKYEAYCIILDKKNIDKAISLIKNSKDNAGAILALSKTFGLTRYQAGEVLKLRLNTLSKMNIAGIHEEAEAALKLYQRCRKMLNDSGLIRDEIAQELREGIKKYGRPRRAKLVSFDNNLGEDNDVKYIIYNESEYYCVKSMEDVQKFSSNITATYKLLQIRNSSSVFIFSETGTCCMRDGYSFTYSINPINMEKVAFSNVVSIVELSKTSREFAFVTRAGFVKRMHISDISATKRIIPLSDGDKLSAVVDVTGESGILFMYTKDSVYYKDKNSLPVLKKGGAGNRAVRSLSSDIIGATFVEGYYKYLMILGEYGYVKVLATEFLTVRNKKDNIINFDGKTIFDVIPFNTNAICYQENGETIYLNISMHNNSVKFNSENKHWKDSKVKLGTVISAPVKLFKSSKSGFIKIVR